MKKKRKRKRKYRGRRRRRKMNLNNMALTPKKMRKMINYNI
jgi:hypothetical protein